MDCEDWVSTDSLLPAPGEVEFRTAGAVNALNLMRG